MRIISLRSPALIVANAIAVLLACLVIAADGEDGNQRAKSKIIVSKETTYLLGPLDEEGGVDYVAAINEAASKGVTPENNFVVALWQILGPNEVDVHRERYFKLLGVTAPPENGEYYRTPSQHVQKLLEKAYIKPWSGTDFPELVAWLASNDKFLQRLVDSSRRTRYYSPAVAGKNRPRVVLILLPASLPVSHVATALSARAMLSVHKGRLDEAFQDALACHRLARLTGQGPELVESSVCRRLDWLAARVELAIAASGRLRAEQCRAFAAELDKLPQLPSIPEKLRWFERLSLLDAIETAEPDLIDPNDALRIANKWFERMADAAAQPTVLKRRAGYEQFDRDRNKLRGDSPSLLARAKGETRKIAGDSLVAQLLPPLADVVRNEDDDRQLLELVRIAFAIASYHAEHEGYPTRLADLAPKYIAEVPKDLYSERDLTYRSTSTGYVLYSVGPNGVDDGGHDSDSKPKGDDIVVRVPSESNAK
jgi:hypothetical protein